MKRYYFTSGKTVHYLVDKTFKEYHGITMACITFDEETEIVGFLNHIKPFVKSIVMIDGGSTDKTVELAAFLVDSMKIIKFTGHLGNQKNNAIAMVDTDWTLFLDPDERLSEKLLSKLPELIETDEFDCYSFPRREILSGKENPAPWPDYQDRLFRTYCRFIRPIHHELVGYKKKYIFPEDSGMEIIHSKELQRHIDRNTGHGCFERHLKHEMGYPGAQTEESFSRVFPRLTEELFEKKA